MVVAITGLMLVAIDRQAPFLLRGLGGEQGGDAGIGAVDGPP